MNKKNILLAVLVALPLSIQCAEKTTHGDKKPSAASSKFLPEARDYEDGDRKREASDKFDDPRSFHANKEFFANKTNISEVELERAITRGTQEGIASQHAWRFRVPAEERANERILFNQYLRKNGPGFKKKMGDAVQDGVLGGVSQGVATVVASAIIVIVSKPFGFIWDKTCSCYSYIITPRDEKATIARMRKLSNEAVKLQTDLELKKLEISMTKNQFALIEKEKELKTLKDQLEITQEKERKRIIDEFVAAHPKDVEFAPAHPSELNAPPAAPAA